MQAIMNDSVKEYAGLTSQQLRTYKKEKQIEFNNSTARDKQILTEIEVAANIATSKEQLDKDPNYINHKLEHGEFAEVIRLVITQDYSTDAAWDKMAQSKTRRPDWLKKVKNKNLHDDVNDILKSIERHDKPDIIKKMKEYGTYNSTDFSRASTYNSAANKVRKAMDKTHKIIEKIQHREELVNAQAKTIAKLTAEVTHKNVELTANSDCIAKLESINKDLKKGILKSSSFNWRVEAEKLHEQGINKTNIAKTVGVTRETVTRYLNSVNKNCS